MSDIKHVKLIAKPDTWFKAGTEVFDYDADYDEHKRITLNYWNQCVAEQGICVRGIRVCEAGYETMPTNEGGMGCELGEERIDGEYCSCDEFEVEIL